MKLYTGSFKWGSEFFFIWVIKKKVYGYNLFVLYVIHFGDQIQLTLLQFFMPVMNCWFY